MCPNPSCFSSDFRKIVYYQRNPARYVRAQYQFLKGSYLILLAIRAGETLTTAPTGMVRASWTRIDLATLRRIVCLAASTLDLKAARQHEDIGKMRRRALNILVHDSTAALERFLEQLDPEGSLSRWLNHCRLGAIAPWSTKHTDLAWSPPEKLGVFCRGNSLCVLLGKSQHFRWWQLKYFVFSALPGKIIQFDCTHIFFKWVETTT